MTQRNRSPAYRSSLIALDVRHISSVSRDSGVLVQDATTDLASKVGEQTFFLRRLHVSHPREGPKLTIDPLIL